MGYPRIQVNKADFIYAYLHDKMTGLEMARHFGIGRSTVSRLLKQWGIHERSISEVRANKKWNSGEEQRHKMSELAKSQVGEKGTNWKGGKSWRGRDRERSYIIVRVGRVYVPEHRLVVERFIGRKLDKSEHVHHLNGDKKDNRIENLKVVSNSEHHAIHWDADRRASHSEHMKKLYGEGKLLKWQTYSGEEGHITEEL